MCRKNMSMGDIYTSLVIVWTATRSKGIEIFLFAFNASGVAEGVPVGSAAQRGTDPMVNSALPQCCYFPERYEILATLGY